MIDLGRLKTLLLQTKLNTDNPALFQFLNQLLDSVKKLSDDASETVEPQTAHAPTVGIVIGDGSTPIATGVAGYISVPFSCTIISVTLLSTDPAVTSGSIVVDIWKDTYANYPPTVADTITAGAKPTISSDTQSQDNTLVGWNKNIAAGDVLGFNVDSVTSFTQITLSLRVI